MTETVVIRTPMRVEHEDECIELITKTKQQLDEEDKLFSLGVMKDITWFHTRYMELKIIIDYLYEELKEK